MLHQVVKVMETNIDKCLFTIFYQYKEMTAKVGDENRNYEDLRVQQNKNDQDVLQFRS